MHIFNNCLAVIIKLYKIIQIYAKNSRKNFISKYKRVCDKKILFFFTICDIYIKWINVFLSVTVRMQNTNNDRNSEEVESLRRSHAQD